MATYPSRYPEVRVKNGMYMCHFVADDSLPGDKRRVKRVLSQMVGIGDCKAIGKCDVRYVAYVAHSIFTSNGFSVLLGPTSPRLIMVIFTLIGKLRHHHGKINQCFRYSLP